MLTSPKDLTIWKVISGGGRKQQTRFVGLDWLTKHNGRIRVRERSLEIVSAMGKRITVAGCGGASSESPRRGDSNSRDTEGETLCVLYREGTKRQVPKRSQARSQDREDMCGDRSLTRNDDLEIALLDSCLLYTSDAADE